MFTVPVKNYIRYITVLTFLILATVQFNSATTFAQANKSPIITGTPLRSAEVGVEYNFTPTAIDPEGGNLTFSIVNQPSWANFDTTTGVLSGTPTAVDVGHALDIVISVTDGTATSALTKFDLSVNDPSLSYSPSSLLFRTGPGGTPESQIIKIAVPPTPIFNTGGTSHSWLEVGFPPQFLGGKDGNNLWAVEISVDRQGLPIGTEIGTVSPGGTDINVTLIVEEPSLKPAQTLLNFASVTGGTPPASQNLRIESTGAALNWNATSDETWVTLGSSSGPTGTDLEVSVDPTGLPEGVNYATINLTQDTQTVPVIVRLNVSNDPVVELTALEVTQGLQDLLNTMPLVEGRRTFVRAHVRSRSDTIYRGVTAQLVVKRGTTEVDTLEPINKNPALTILRQPNREVLGDSYLFSIPESLVNGEITLEFEGVSQPFTCSDVTATPNDCAATVSFEFVPPMPIDFIHGSMLQNGQRVMTNADTQVCAVRGIKTYLPVSDVDATRLPGDLHIDTPPPAAKDFPDNNQYFNALVGWMGPVLDKVNTRWQTEGRPAEHYYGLFGTGFGGMASLSGYYGMGGSNPSTTVHELGHNLGLRHAPCGTVNGLDPNWPTTHPDARISAALTGDSALYGFNIFNGQIYLPDSKDVMSYCGNSWISDHHYTKTIEALKTHYNQPIARRTEQIIAPPDTAITMISGQITPTTETLEGQIASISEYRSADNVIAPTAGDYALQLLDASGTTIRTIPFEVEHAHYRDVGRRSFTVPITETLAPTGVTTINLLYQDTLLDTVMGSNTSPFMTITEFNGHIIDYKEYRSFLHGQMSKI